LSKPSGVVKLKFCGWFVVKLSSSVEAFSWFFR
jgi:hypothetical protein